ncbi:acyl-CoA carboxylase epsilon subunit [Streptomyces sp. CG1]|uniref:acyl-CoA carboxylase epsilon subunit n=1 Tax=Streptomyces sp. CG1 TaxID=1287523 RepID=UPI0034E1B24D
MSEPPFEGPLGATLWKVVRGVPTAEELAVLTVVLTTLLRAGGNPESGPLPAGAPWDRPAGCSPVSWSARR